MGDGHSDDSEEDSVVIQPDMAGSSNEANDIGAQHQPGSLPRAGQPAGQGSLAEDRPEPDYELTLEMADRTVTLTLAEGEPMALQNQLGQPFAQLTVEDLDN